MKQIASRMPLVFNRREDQRKWLADMDLNEILHMLKTPTNNILKLYRISDKVNSVKNNSSELHQAIKRSNHFISLMLTAMRLVIQRVSEASVTIEGKIKGQIGLGLVILLGIQPEDDISDIEWLCKKVINMRIFNDDEGKMNLSILDIKGAFLLISQFTLFASTKKGNRPGFTGAAKPATAIPLYEKFIQALSNQSGLEVQTGTFGADMKVALVNDGPTTIIIDSKNRV